MYLRKLLQHVSRRGERRAILTVKTLRKYTKKKSQMEQSTFMIPINYRKKMSIDFFFKMHIPFINSDSEVPML